MDTLELKRHFLPILQDVQLRMCNLQQDGLNCEITLHSDYISFLIAQFYYDCADSIQVWCNLYDFDTLGQNERKFNNFKLKVKHELGIIL